jgi:hypothetical protein
MANYDIKSFTTSAAADSYFKNVIQEDDGKGAIYLKTAGFLTYSHNGNAPDDIGPSEEAYIVIRLPPSSKIEADQVMIESKVAAPAAAGG